LPGNLAKAITLIVAPVMLLELVTGLLLWLRAPAHPVWIINMLGILVLWASTAFWQVPLHNQLPLGDGQLALL
jgi:hypothetical protein